MIKRVLIIPIKIIRLILKSGLPSSSQLPPPKVGRSPPKSCLGRDLGGFPGGDLRVGFGRI